MNFSKIVIIEPYITPHNKILKALNKGKILQIDSGGGIRDKRQLVVNIVKDNFENNTIKLTTVGQVIEENGEKFFNMTVYEVSETKNGSNWNVNTYAIHF